MVLTLCQFQAFWSLLFRGPFAAHDLRGTQLIWIGVVLGLLYVSENRLVCVRAYGIGVSVAAVVFLYVLPCVARNWVKLSFFDTS